jgi:alanine-glyoxylate transaminase/(R)-3-amino-2-methylpropionate-pyruvate transaminase
LLRTSAVAIRLQQRRKMSLSRALNSRAWLSGVQQARAFASQPAAEESGAALPKIPPFDYTPRPYVGPSYEETMALRKAHLNPGARPGRGAG